MTATQVRLGKRTPRAALPAAIAQPTQASDVLAAHPRADPKPDGGRRSPHHEEPAGRFREAGLSVTDSPLAEWGLNIRGADRSGGEQHRGEDGRHALILQVRGCASTFRLHLKFQLARF